MCMMALFGAARAQVPIPEMELRTDDRGLEIVNTANAPYLLVNVTVMWEGSEKRWSHFPDELILEAQQGTAIPYAAFAGDYQPGQENGAPTIVSFILLSENDKYVALNFRRSADGGFVGDDDLNRELTQLYQRLPPPMPPDTGK
jgi:hypothetical protein